MIAKLRVLARLTALVVAVPAVALLGAMPQAMAVTSHRPLNDTRPVGTAPVTVGFPIEYFGLVADLPPTSTHLPEHGPAPFGEARFRVRGHWGAWRPIDQDGAQARGQFTGSLMSVDRADAYQVRGLPTGATHWRGSAINTTDGPSVVVAHRQAGSAAAAPGCMSRADWGADESITGWSRGTDTQTFHPVQVLTVHHTAGSNDPAQDFAATVRAIYSFHVQTNGWADIGYQYLVDPQGTVYEGRNSGHTSTSCRFAGGDGSDFAHQTSSDDVVTGAHVANSNSGNAGIALMGCFDPSSACSGNTNPAAPAVDGLESLLASLSDRHGLDPQGRVHYVNPVSGAAKDVDAISGHRDWEATACPGSSLYAALPAIRADVASRTGTPSATITSGSCRDSTCTFTGTGVGTLRWTFGNGTTATGSPVTGKYVYKGIYQVTLTDSQSPATTASRTVACQKARRTLRCST